MAFIGWFGPRGLASIVFLDHRHRGFERARVRIPEVLIATIGWTVLLSVVLHGLSAAPLARRYGTRIAATPGDIPERELSEEPQPSGEPQPSTSD